MVDSEFAVDTTHQGQAIDIASKLPLEFDAVITVSGDGLVHEILNGFSKHASPLEALSTPIAPIPTGSGNGLSLNLLGIEVRSESTPSFIHHTYSSSTLFDRMDST